MEGPMSAVLLRGRDLRKHGPHRFGQARAPVGSIHRGRSSPGLQIGLVRDSFSGYLLAISARPAQAAGAETRRQVGGPVPELTRPVLAGPYGIAGLPDRRIGVQRLAADAELAGEGGLLLPGGDTCTEFRDTVRRERRLTTFVYAGLLGDGDTFALAFL